MNPARGRRFVAWLVGIALAVGAAAPAAAQSNGQPEKKLSIPAVNGPIRPDTFLHIIGGMMTGMFAASAASALESTSSIRRYPLFLPAVGFSAALAAGMAKETLDSTGFGDPQWSDLFHTMIGGLLVAGMITAIELSPGAGSNRAQSNVYALWGVSLSVPIGAAFAEEIHVYLVRRRLEK